MCTYEDSLKRKRDVTVVKKNEIKIKCFSLFLLLFSVELLNIVRDVDDHTASGLNEISLMTSG